MTIDKFVPGRFYRRKSEDGVIMLCAVNSMPGGNDALVFVLLAEARVIDASRADLQWFEEVQIRSGAT